MTPILTGVIASGISGHLTPPWSPEGAYDSLATVTVGSTSVSSIIFAGIPTGYKHLQVRYIVKSVRTGNPLDELNLRFNGDTGSNYAQHALAGDGGSTFANAIASGNNIELGSGFIGDSESGSQFGVGIVDILDYASTSRIKIIRMLGGVDFNGTVGGTGGRVGLGSGLWNNTSPTTSLTFYAENGNIIQHSQFALYGVK